MGADYISLCNMSQKVKPITNCKYGIKKIYVIIIREKLAQNDQNYEYRELEL